MKFETLRDLIPGQESGILVWDDDSVAVDNWVFEDYGPNCLPILDPFGIALIAWPYASITVDGSREVEDIRDELPGRIVKTDEVDERHGVRPDSRRQSY